MTAEDLSEVIRSAQEAAYEQALKDERYNRMVPTIWMCSCHLRQRWNGHHTAYCWAKPVEPMKRNPYRKV